MKEFSKLIQKQFDLMSQSGKLFRVNLSGQTIWDLYLNSFPEEYNSVFRDPESSEMNCNHCKNFIRRYGNVVSIDGDYNITTMFDVEADEVYNETAKQLSKVIKNSTVLEVFFETFNELNSLPYEHTTKSNPVFQLGFVKNTKRYTKEESLKGKTIEELEALLK